MLPGWARPSPAWGAPRVYAPCLQGFILSLPHARPRVLEDGGANDSPKPDLGPGVGDWSLCFSRVPCSARPLFGRAPAGV